MSIGGKEFTMNFDDVYPSLKIDVIIASPDPLCEDCYLVEKVLIDTGCERTIIPNEVVNNLNLKYTGETIDFTGFNEDYKNPVKVKILYS